LLLACASSVAIAADDTPKVRVCIIDGQNNHAWRATTPILRSALEKSGRFSVAVSSHLKAGDKGPASKDAIAFPPDLSRFDVVVSNYNGQPWPKEFQTALADGVRGGKVGLVVFHAANNAFTGWPEFNDMIGMGWRGNKFGERLYLDADAKPVRQPKGEGPGAGETTMHPFKVVVRDAAHPVTKGMPREWMHAADQLVHGLRGPIKNVTVLATAYSDKAKRGTGEHEAMVWTVAYGEGRVFHTPMGHDAGSVRCVGFQTALLRGAEWAATGKVTLPIPEAFPPADKTSSVKP